MENLKIPTKKKKVASITISSSSQFKIKIFLNKQLFSNLKTLVITGEKEQEIYDPPMEGGGDNYKLFKRYLLKRDLLYSIQDSTSSIFLLFEKERWNKIKNLNILNTTITVNSFIAVENFIRDFKNIVNLLVKISKKRKVIFYEEL